MKKPVFKAVGRDKTKPKVANKKPHVSKHKPAVKVRKSKKEKKHSKKLKNYLKEEKMLGEISSIPLKEKKAERAKKEKELNFTN